MADMADESTLLAERAALFRKLILDVAMGPGGMIISFLPFDTRRPFQEGEEAHWFLARNLEEAWGPFTPRPTVAEWYYGENTLWATGMFLWSQMLRHRATGEQEALDTARKCFRDLSNIFRLCRQIEPGLLGKPHGGRAGPTTSYDQAANPVLFYVEFARDFGTPAEQAEMRENMALHGDYYLRRNWVMNHHGNLQRIVDPAHTSTMKYLACVHAAYAVTGETRFRDAAFRYLRQIIQTGRLPWPTNPYETNHNPFYWGFLCDYWSRTEIGGEYDWINCIRAYWRAMQLTYAPDGLPLIGHYDSASHAFTPYPDRWLTQDDAKEFPAVAPRKTARRWISSTAFGNRGIVGSMTTVLGLLARAHGIDDNVCQLGKRTLLQIDENALRWWWDDGKLPPELKPINNIFAPETAAAWLAAYWMGRLHGAW